MADIDEFRQLLEFSRKGTLSGAARVLHLSQPSLTRTMRRLESECKVSLFERSAGSIALNDNGRMAVDYADRIVSLYDEMVGRIREFDMARRSITVCSCAPVPLIEATKTLKRLFPGTAIRGTIADDGTMEEMLESNDCGIVIMNHPLTSDAVVCMPYMGETLHLSVPNGHLLASYDAIRFRDFNGYDIVVHPDIGFWMDICLRHLPSSRLLVQQTGESFAAIVENTELLYFSTPEAAYAYGREAAWRTGRKAIRIVDKDAAATYYCVCRKDHVPALDPFIRDLSTSSLGTAGA